MALAPLPRTFDGLFEKHGGPIPVAFLRALSAKESGMNPNSCARSACGLLQVVDSVVLPGFNASHGTAYNRASLLNPDVNVEVAADLIKRIMNAFSRHPDPNMKPNFSNKEFVKLLLAGWNSGYSEGGGVGKVASYLEQRSIPVTHDSIFAHASAAGATQHLSNTAKQRWQREVADLYFAQPDAFGLLASIPLWAKLGVTGIVAVIAARYFL